ncbi:MAG: GNAT family N-acetyltransferase, partial [Gemmatimonadota bacterium]
MIPDGGDSIEGEMALRPAEAKDVEPLARLWNRAFPGERTVEERIRRLETGEPWGGLEDVWVEEGDGRLVGAFRTHRMTEYLAGAPVPMLGLAAVAVASSARRRGVGRRMCEAAIRIGRERGDLVSVLYPFRPSYYHALGWGMTGELRAFHFRPQALDAAGLDPDDDTDIGTVRAAEPDDHPAIADCYARVAARSHGPIRRDERAWRHHLAADRTYAFIVEDGGGGVGGARETDIGRGGDDGDADAPSGTPAAGDLAGRDGRRHVHGYLLARFERRRSPESSTLYVHELAADDDAAYRALLAWMANQRDQWSWIRYDARRDETFEHRLADARPPRSQSMRGLWFPTGRVLRGPMLRVLDLPGAVRARTRWGVEVETALTFRLEVDDPIVPENRGPWDVAVRERSAE